MNGLATYTFLPWLRRGISTEITRVDGSTGSETHAQIPITLSIDAAGDLRDTSVTLDLYGPGEVAGIDPRMIIRTDPKPGVADAEPNYFCTIDLHEAEFLWRFTPAVADANDRLSPWIVLIVLAAAEIKEERPARSNGSLAQVLLESGVPLPDLSQSWAWAHAQIDALEEGESVETIVESQPNRTSSRLICPRKLHPHTPYTAFLVPAFERGRLAGLSETINDTEDSVVDALTPAWTPDDNDVRLPVYYKWQFSTGAQGDFEFLVRKLKPRQITNVGKRDIDVSEPDTQLHPASNEPLEIEGALRSLTAKAAPWPPAERTRFLQGDVDKIGLVDLVNRPQELLEGGESDPIVAPPLYGRWHAKENRLKPDQPPPWFNRLNEDPRHRATASVGTRIVQQQQEQIMASAWEQLEDIQSINEKLCQTQLGRELSDRVRLRYLDQLADAEVVNVTSPVHRRIRTSPTTVYAACRKAQIGYFGEGVFRRVTRARGAISRRLKNVSGRVADRLLNRANSGDIRPAPAPVTQDTLTTDARVIDTLNLEGSGGLLRIVGWLLMLIAMLLVVLVLILGMGPTVIGLAILMAMAMGLFGWDLRRRGNRHTAVAGLGLGTLTPDVVNAVSPPRNFVPVASGSNSHIPTPPSGTNVSDAQGVDAFRTAMADLALQAFAPLPLAVAPVPLGLAQVRQTLITKLNPRINHPLAVAERLTIADWVDWKPRDPLDKVMASPEIDQPMYEPLRDWSQEWLLPGVGKIPENTTGLLLTNQAFIEAYMAGINHEIVREFVWRELPTDLRATVCQQFWDVRGVVRADTTTATSNDLLDVKKMHQWDRNELGGNSPRPRPPGGEHLVLLVRGEVLKRYPNTLVYAVEAVRDTRGLLDLGTQERHPVFGGTLSPDLSFFGFELTKEEVRGGDGDDGAPGWFFVLQQQPTEPRFGLDVPDVANAGDMVGSTWDSLSWGHLVSDLDEMQNFGYIDLNADRPDTRFTDTSEAVWQPTAGTDAAQLAYITLQKPFRVAMHGKAMVPNEA